MYLTEFTIYLLSAGIVTLSMAAIRPGKSLFKEILELRFLGCLIIWVGYHLAPWCAYLHEGRWGSFLLVPAYVDQGLFFSILCMISYQVGFDLYAKHSSIGIKAAELQRSILIVPKVKLSHVLFMVCGSLALFFYNVGGLGEVWISSQGRGGGYVLNLYGLSAKIHRVIEVVSFFYHTILACIVSIFMLQERKNIYNNVIGVVCLLVASLPSIHYFSRGCGYAFVIYAFFALRIKGERFVPVAIVAALFALYLGGIGFEQRNNYQPGLGNFLHAAFEGNKERRLEGDRVFGVPKPERISWDSMAPWTRKTQSYAFEKENTFELGKRFFWNIAPLPSQIMQLKPVGRDLSEIMRVTKSMGVTTPAIAELYYVFGFYGCWFFLLFGAIVCFFEKNTVLNPGVATSICLLLCFISLPIGIHSAVRAMTRPVLYAMIIHFLYKTFFEKRMIRITGRK